MAARRSYGTGSLYVRKDSTGRETWYGKWHSNGRRVKRAIGPKGLSKNGVLGASVQRETDRPDRQGETARRPAGGVRSGDRAPVDVFGGG